MRWPFLILMTVAAVALCSPGARGERSPNIVLIMADDVGYEGLSSYGSTTYKTPHLDRLARNGARFRHCYSQPICTPSRVQIMTGKYNHRNYTVFGKLRTDQTTFANLLRDAGYATAIAGKWQLGGGAETVRSFGFDQHCLWHLDGRQSRYWEPRISENGKLRTDVGDRFGPDVVCDFLLNFIDQNRERPFLVYYPMMLPHWPFIPTPDSPLGGSRERKGKYDGRPGGEEYFPDMVAYLDSLVGRIDAKLAEVGVRDNTLLIFTADNGCAINIVSRRGDEVIKGGKGSMPDAGTHAPLIASWPAVIEKATVNDSLVDFSDVLPTLLDVAGVRTPSELKTDGLSFLPQLKGAAEGRRQWVFCHYNPRPPRATADPKKKQQALNKLTKLRTQKQLGRFARTQQFKLYDDGRFYDVAADVLESRAIDVGVATTKVKRVHEMLQKVLDSQPEFQYFAAAGAKKKTNKKQPANKQ